MQINIKTSGENQAIVTQLTAEFNLQMQQNSD